MAINLKEETILNQWSMLVEGACGRANQLYDDIAVRLGIARIPGNCSWSREEVQSGGMLSKVRREFLIVRLEQFADYRSYVGIRDYGANLSCCRFLTVEPGFFKRELSKALTGGEDRLLSTPKNILQEQDLSAWVTVVHHCVVDAVKALVAKLGQDPAGVRTSSKGFLEVW
jgi:hypothetical protein